MKNLGCFGNLGYLFVWSRIILFDELFLCWEMMRCKNDKVEKKMPFL